LPNWYVIGILISFSDKFATQMNVQGPIDPGKAIMVAYAAISVGDILIGFISQWFEKPQSILIHFSCHLGHRYYLVLSPAGAACEHDVPGLCCLRLGTGFWAMFVTMAASSSERISVLR